MNPLLVTEVVESLEQTPRPESEEKTHLDVMGQDKARHAAEAQKPKILRLLSFKYESNERLRDPALPFP